MTRPTQSIFHHQGKQLLISLLVIVFSYFYYETLPASLTTTTIIGLSPTTWFWSTILIPIFHQLIIAPLWRMELLDQSLSKTFGSTTRAFTVFKIIFALFFIPRLLTPVPLALATQQSISYSWLRTLFLIIGILLTPIIVYGMYSVIRYFGINRAFGADHFFEEYRSMPLVQEGLFKYTDNAMYTYVLAVVLLPGLYLGSSVALVAGIISQGMVWVHYFATEKPDLEYIYGQ